MATPKQPAWSDYVPDAEGEQQLDTQVFADRHGPRDFLPPPRVRPETVRRFIDARFANSLTPDQMQRMGDLTRFYVLSDSSRKFLQPLERRDRTPLECHQSVVCVRVLGDAGDTSQQHFAGEYFDYLTGLVAFDRFAGDLTLSFFSLDPTRNAAKLEARLDSEIKRLLPEQKDPEWPQGQCREYVELRENVLPLVEAAKARKDKLLIEADELKRATEWARLYLALEDPGGVDWGTCAGYALLAEARRSSRENVVAGLRAAVSAVKPSESKAYRAFAQQRAARAVAYLGGLLTPDEERWLGDMPERAHLLAG